MNLGTQKMSKVAKALSKIPSFLVRKPSSVGVSGKSSPKNAIDFPFVLPPQLPEDEGKLTVVLDLDETLIHSKLPRGLQDLRQEEERKEELEPYHDFFEVVVFSETFRVHKRPGLDKFLEEASQQYELICFTAGIQEYAEVLMDAIDPDKKYFRHRLFRNHCVQVGNSFVKDLRVVNRRLERTVLVDNNAFSFLMQLANGIPVSSFMDDATDTALHVLRDFLETIREHHDVREHLRNVFSLESLLGDSAKSHLESHSKHVGMEIE
jgi:Dullard-like phosphatase family protein